MSAGSAAVALPRLVRPKACDLQAMSDEQLLARFFQSRDDSAFVVLLRRYGPLVYGVCRRVLRDANDAEDAFQATFLVLVRKGQTICNPSRLGSWLYGVAYRTARKAKAQAARRCRLETEAVAMQPTNELDSMTYQEMSEILEEEIGRLPDKYSSVLVLCYLEGKTNAQAAALLGWREGSLSRRLSRAREILRSRLTRRGLTLSAMLMAAVFARPAAANHSPLLAETTARAAGLLVRGVAMDEVVAPGTAALVRDVVRDMPAAGRVVISAIVAIAAVFLALAVVVRQVGIPAFSCDLSAGSAAQAEVAPAGCGTADGGVDLPVEAGVAAP
jgi:RNA polymerase sigma factor (sigma-70 family)